MSTESPTYYSGAPQTFPPRYVSVGPGPEVFTIVFAAPKYPERFTNREDAEKRSKQVGRPVQVSTPAVYKRVTP